MSLDGLPPPGLLRAPDQVCGDLLGELGLQLAQLAQDRVQFIILTVLDVDQGAAVLRLVHPGPVAPYHGAVAAVVLSLLRVEALQQ